jgi:recombination protein RecR
MDYPAKAIKEAVDKFVKLPGIGKRTAIRMVLNILKMPPDEIEAFGSAINRLHTDIKYCSLCHNISENELCDICSDHSRDKKVICVVEDLRDVIAIENTNQFRGLYHITGGVISPIDGIRPENLNLATLFERLNTDPPSEIIFALRATMEGDTTMFYITKHLEGKNIKFSAIARGISIGTDIEFADEITLGRSILNRTPYSV